MNNIIAENEKNYGEEIRAKYGSALVDQSNAKIQSLTDEQHLELERLSAELNSTLKAALEQGDPASELAQKACELHKRWLCYFWSNYSKEAHIGISQMYIDDERFAAHYDKIAKGCAMFLRDAIAIYCG